MKNLAKLLHAALCIFGLILSVVAMFVDQLVSGDDCPTTQR